MTINTQKLRERIDAAIKRITSGSAPMRIPADQTDPDLVLADAKIALDAQAAQLAAYPADWRSDSSLETWFPLTAEQLKAQAAEIARLKAAQTWQPIETAPKDGSTVLLRGRGDHRIADGYWLQDAYGGLGAWVWPYVHSEPHHWMPLPAGPDALQETSHDR